MEDENQKFPSRYLPKKEKNESFRSRLRKFESVAIKNQWEIIPTETDKPFVVNIEKTECSFDEKRQHCLKYIMLLDEFHRKVNAIFTLQFHPIMNRFLKSNSDNETSNSAIHEYNREVQSLFKQLNEEQIKVKFETNYIRSFSSDKLDELLDKVELAVSQSTVDAADVLKFMVTPELWAGQSLTSPLKKAEDSVQLVLSCRNAVRSRMMTELGKN